MADEVATIEVRLPRRTYAALSRAAQANHATVETFVAQQVAVFLMMTSKPKQRLQQAEQEEESQVGQYL